ncbi:hypothetical protein [Gordonibacter sp. 28C]|uniref:Nmad2 family putative nucleotide modification protein n=1 Tax=Gordonibacter sp. 28C TaxID=2078569 RepID=UPI0011C03146|nr:hypothetical protein [Gordonibacter sp. 28C]
MPPANNPSIFSYIITRDYGFAPNPFPPCCTLATCKPGIRKSAKIGDWIVGCTSNAQSSIRKHSIIFTMQVSEKMSFNEYWNDPRFKCKKPVMNGSARFKYGDNIYHFDAANQEFIQENSHHSLPGGERNIKNYRRDLRADSVLIAEKYWYWGASAIRIPPHLSEIECQGRGYKKITDSNLINNLESWLGVQPASGIIGRPTKFSTEFERYRGE